MTTWFLIVWLVACGQGCGVSSTVIEFNMQSDCLSAKQMVSDSPERFSVWAVCVPNNPRQP